MGIFIKLLIFLFVLACSAPFFLKGSSGMPLISIDKLKLPDLSFDSLKSKTAQSSSKDSLEVYKWRDEKGVIHYSDKKGADKKARLTQIQGISILPSAPIEPEKTVNQQTNSFPSPTTVPLADIPKLIQDAKQVEQLVQGRKQRQDEMLDSMR